MLFGPREGVVEEDYYLAEFTEEERAAGLADAAMKFAQESKSQRSRAQEEDYAEKQGAIPAGEDKA